MQAPAPPSAGDLMRQMTEPSLPVVDDVSPRDRLIFGAKVANKVPDRVIPPAPDVAVQAQTLKRSRNPLDPGVVNLAARLRQHRAQQPDEDRAAADVQRLFDNRKLVKGPASGLLERLSNGDPLKDDEWDQASQHLSTMSDALAPIGDDLMVGNGKVVAIDPQPAGASVQIEYPKSSSLEDLPMSLAGGVGDTLPAYTLDAKVGGGLTVFAGATDVTYAAPVTPERDRQLRALYPGPVGADGVPRWAKVEPVAVKDHRAITAGLDQGAVSDLHPDRNSYVGTRPGDWIVFAEPTVPEPNGWQPPSYMTGVERLRGGVARSKPALQIVPVRQDELTDAQTVQQRLDDHAWAVLSPQGSATATSTMLARVKAKGLDPIVVDGDGGQGWLVFGIEPDDAEVLSRNAPVYTHDGVINAGAEWDEREDLPSWRVPTADGTSVSFNAVEGEPVGRVGRSSAPLRMNAWRIPQELIGRVSGIASELEARGATDVVAYTRHADIDGFEPAREYLFDDGVSLRTVRTAATTVGESNAVPVHVRSTVGLPTDPFRVSPESVDWRQAQFVDHGSHVVVDTGDDLVGGVKSASLLGHAIGPDKVHLIGPNGRVRLYQAGKP